MKRSDFVYSGNPEPHRIRTKQILRQNPEIRKLIGKNPATFFAILFLVVAQTALSVVLGQSSWWLIIPIAYLVGAFIDHALFVMIHECTHKLIFKNKSANR